MDYNKPRGHRVFSVINPDVQELVVQALLDTGLREDKRFTSGPSTQVVFNDGTVVNYLDRAKVPDLPGNALTLDSSNPRASAEKFAGLLREKGYDAQTIAPIAARGDAFVVVFSLALEHWMLGFRAPEIKKIEEELSRK
jgi:hypothetical protein